MNTHTQLRDFLTMANVDGIWLDMNECSSFCDGSCTEDYHKKIAMQRVKTANEFSGRRVKRHGFTFNANDPPYHINNRCHHAPLYKMTISVDAEHYGGVLEYDAHNIYGMVISAYLSTVSH